MSEETRLVIKSGNVFDSIEGKMKENLTIVVKNNEIAWVGDEGSFEKEETDNIIDATGKTVLPGMVECHVHLSGTGDPQYEKEYLRTKRDMYNFIALDNAQKHLVSGFTCVRDAGSYKGIVSSLKRILNYGIFAGPRLVGSETGIWQWGDSESIGPQALVDFDREVSVIKAGVDNIKYAVRDQKRLGADFITTATTGGVLHGMESKVSLVLWTDEELDAMLAEAHRLGMHIGCHAHGNDGIQAAVRAGIDTIEHGTFITEETAKMMVAKGTYLIPTRSAIVCLASSSIHKQMPPEVQTKITECFNKAKENHQIALEKGVKIAIGTDAATPGNFHGNTGLEIKLMVDDIGMTPVQAMQAATIEGARAIWLDDKIGSLEKGKLADIVICDKNPLEDISAVVDPLNFSHVIKDGKVMAGRGRIAYFSPLQKIKLD